MYDKGVEAKDPDYEGVLRLEEQVRRGGSVMPKLYGERLTLDVEACRELLNERVGQVCQGPVLALTDVKGFMQARQWRALVLAMHPEYLSVYKQTASRSQYYKAAREVREIRADAVGVDLAVPDHAWLN